MKHLINTVIHGDCLEVIKQLPDNSIDSVVTDPPYNLTSIIKRFGKDGSAPAQFGSDGAFSRLSKGFMGKEWDGTGIAFKIALWAEVLRVLKPGGHLLAFGGTRTYHRMACAIEDAGFEIRDCIQWIYGSGFPKSLDLSKAIDKSNGVNIGWFGEWLKDWRTKNGITQKDIAQLFPSKNGGITGCVANWELGLNMPTAEQFNTICRAFKLPFADIEQVHREVMGRRIKSRLVVAPGQNNGRGSVELNITAPATLAAKKWNGWGTALKPANEPIVVARKPISEASIAANVLKWGTGGINIDACRIPTGETLHGGEGRFPANIILSEEAAAMLDDQSGISQSKSAPRGGTCPNPMSWGKQRADGDKMAGHNDSGGTSRFFYVAKASRSERGEGNNHPTVKPIQLMRYLVRLVTPPEGIVLDPFAGSGSTLIAAKAEGVSFIGIEQDAHYCEIARARIQNYRADYGENNADDSDQLSLFGEAEGCENL